jgi:pilus assembly protein CpaB
MQRNRVLIAFGIAWLSALLLSWWVYRQSTASPARDVVTVVAAAQDLPAGRRLQGENLKLITLDRRDVPKGAFLKTGDVVDRAATVPLTAGELVLTSKLAAKGSGEGLMALIEPGMRAVSVQINEISGVSGFIQPGSRVDILFTRVFSNGDAATTTILQNVKVIAYGRQLDASRTDAATAAARPTVATVLVTPDEAERLVLAEQRGRIQLVLRNGLDDEFVAVAEPIRAADLGIEEPARPAPAAPVRPAYVKEPVVEPAPVVRAAAEPAKAEKEPHVVRIYRGEKVTEEKIP